MGPLWFPGIGSSRFISEEQDSRGVDGSLSVTVLLEHRVLDVLFLQ